jgi:hypothetical protein
MQTDKLENGGGGQIEVYTIHADSNTHCKEIWIYVFPEKELRGPIPNFHIHVSVSDLYLYSHVRPAYYPAAE